MDDSDFHSIETITVTISFWLRAVAPLSIVNNTKNIRLSGTRDLVPTEVYSLSHNYMSPLGIFHKKIKK